MPHFLEHLHVYMNVFHFYVGLFISSCILKKYYDRNSPVVFTNFMLSWKYLAAARVTLQRLTKAC